MEKGEAAGALREERRNNRWVAEVVEMRWGCWWRCEVRLMVEGVGGAMLIDGGDGGVVD